MSNCNLGTPPPAAASLQEIEARIAQHDLPPVHLWQPTHVGSMDLIIRRDGSWLYQGSKIHRERMVKLFSTILRREGDGRHCLVTPAEKLFIEVEDAPFVVVAMQRLTDSDADPTVVFTSNVGEEFMLDSQHPLWLETDQRGYPKPYVTVRNGLHALINRSVYYQLVDSCVERSGRIGIHSRGQFFELGDAHPSDDTHSDLVQGDGRDNA